MRNTFPSYASRVASLYARLESCYMQAGKCTKKALLKLPSNSWRTGHDADFELIKQHLAASVKLAHLKPNLKLSLFTGNYDPNSFP